MFAAKEEQNISLISMEIGQGRGVWLSNFDRLLTEMLVTGDVDVSGVLE